MKTTRAATLAALAVLCMLAGCDRARSAPEAAAQEAAAQAAPTAAEPEAQDDTYEYPALFDRMGGEEVIDRVAADFVTRLGADKRITNPRVRARLEHAEPRNLKAQMAAVLCDAADGPCVYEGRDMRAVHSGLGISDRDFDAAMEDLGAALEAARVPAQERDELTAVVGDMRGDIVEVRTVLDR